MSTQALSDDAETTLVRTTRATVGDEVRSVTYFTPDDVEQLYLRNDLEADADVEGFADAERRGFHEQRDYAASELGDYQFTIRVFDDGYLTRVINGDHGVFVTTGWMTRDRFQDLAVAIREELSEIGE